MSKNKQLKDIQTNDDKEVKTVEFETESFFYIYNYMDFKYQR